MAGSDGKASAGDPLRPPPASIWNNMVDAGRQFAIDRLSGGPGDKTGPRSTDIIRVKNTCGEDRAKYEILRIDDKAIEDLSPESIWLKGVEPTAAGYFGILREPCADTEVASLQVSGVCIAKVNIVSVTDTRAGAVAAGYVLESGESGPLEILYHDGTVGEQECVVRFGGSGGISRWGLVTASIGCGYYTIQLGTWSGDMDTAGFGLGVDPDPASDPDINCDICYDITGAGTSACAITLSYPPAPVTGDGTFVKAYDPASVLIPLVVGSACLIENGGDKVNYLDVEYPLWRVKRGLMTHVVQYKENWDCCLDSTPPVETLISKTPVILIGKECATITCGECPA